MMTRHHFRHHRIQEVIFTAVQHSRRNFHNCSTSSDFHAVVQVIFTAQPGTHQPELWKCDQLVRGNHNQNNTVCIGHSAMILSLIHTHHGEETNGVLNNAYSCLFDNEFTDFSNTQLRLLKKLIGDLPSLSHKSKQALFFFFVYSTLNQKITK